jgi:hypothetical protein
MQVSTNSFCLTSNLLSVWEIRLGSNLLYIISLGDTEICRISNLLCVISINANVLMHMYVFTHIRLTTPMMEILVNTKHYRLFRWRMLKTVLTLRATRENTFCNWCYPR